jgi:hypothetical protein
VRERHVDGRDEMTLIDRRVDRAVARHHDPRGVGTQATGTILRSTCDCVLWLTVLALACRLFSDTLSIAASHTPLLRALSARLGWE